MTPTPAFRSRLFAAGFATLAGFAPPAGAADPAARLLPPTPVETPTDSVSRGLAPEFQPIPAAGVGRPVPVNGKRSNFFESLSNPTPPAAAWPGGPPKPAPPTPAPAPALSPVSASAPPPSFVDRTWAGVKELVAGKPTAPAPVPPTPAPQPPVAAWPGGPPQAAPAYTPPAATPGVTAGPPAYRWYGWGTTTPGANPFAPAGTTPRGSANWYAQTGATPGAFPVPVVNPFRPPPGAEPPVYVGAAFPPSGDLPPLTPSPAPVRVTAATSVPAVRLTQPAESANGAPLPVLAPGGSGFLPGPAPADVNWQPASATIPAPAAPPAPPAATWNPVKSPPAAVLESLDNVIRDACYGLARGVQVVSPGPNRLVVRFTADTDAQVRAVAAAVSRIPAVRHFEVAFEAKVAGR